MLRSGASPSSSATPYARLKATVTAIAFSLAGLAALAADARPSPELVPDAVVYFTIVLNSFFSLRFFDTWLRVTGPLVIADGVLVGIFLLLARSLGTPVACPLLVTWLFAASIARYAPSLGQDPRLDIVLRRKIKVMIAATGLAGVSLVLALAGHPVSGAWLGVFTNTTGNIYLLLINPLYRLPSEPPAASPA